MRNKNNWVIRTFLNISFLIIILLGCDKNKNPYQPNRSNDDKTDVNTLNEPAEVPEPDNFYKTDFSSFNWVRIFSPPNSAGCILRISLNDILLLAVTESDGGLVLYRSTDHGISWARIKFSFLPCALMDFTIPSNDWICLIGSVGSYEGGTIWPDSGPYAFISKDYGTTWAKILLPRSSYSWMSRFIISKSGSYFAGGMDAIFRSADEGKTWEMRYSGIVGFITQFFEAPNGALFAATESMGVFVSMDDGCSWTQSNNGLYADRSGFFQGIAAIRYGPVSGKIFVADDQKIYTYSTDSWQYAYNAYARIEDMAFDSAENMYLACNLGIGLNVLFKPFLSDSFLSTNSGDEESAFIKHVVINSAGRPFAVQPMAVYRLAGD
jgi:hypothetical protein